MKKFKGLCERCNKDKELFIHCGLCPDCLKEQAKSRVLTFLNNFDTLSIEQYHRIEEIINE